MLTEQLGSYFTTIDKGILVEVIPLEGNIASGKTTLLTQLSAFGIKILYEPLEEWTNVKGSGINALEMYYKCFEQQSKLDTFIDKNHSVTLDAANVMSDCLNFLKGISSEVSIIKKTTTGTSSIEETISRLTKQMTLLYNIITALLTNSATLKEQELGNVVARLRAYQFQNLVYSTRSNQIINICHDKEWLSAPYKHSRRECINGVEYEIRPVITERGNESTEHIFGKRLLDQGVFGREEMAFLNVVFDIKRTHPLDRTIFLATTPETCVKRKEKRAREEEKGSFTELINDIDGYYQRYMKNVHHVFHVSEFELQDCGFMAEQIIEWSTRRPAQRIERTLSRELQITVLPIEA